MNNQNNKNNKNENKNNQNKNENKNQNNQNKNENKNQNEILEEEGEKILLQGVELTLSIFQCNNHMRVYNLSCHSIFSIIL